MMEGNNEGIDQVSTRICYTCICTLTIPLAMVIVGQVMRKPPAAHHKMG
jgi:hypothetical protein